MSDTEPQPVTKEQPKFDEVAELRRQVKKLSARLTTVEALLLKISEKLGLTTKPTD
jgi:hypothetical protein